MRRALIRMRGFTATRRTVALLSAVILFVFAAGGGAAYAFWTTSGTGSGAALVGTGAQNVTVQAATGTPSSSLIPNGTADLTLTIDNPNAFALTITGISQNLSGSISVVGGSGCTGGNSGVSVPTQTALSITIPSGAGQVVHIPGATSMSTASVSGCQGASFRIPVLITVHQP